jgi:hypothetical protein
LNGVPIFITAGKFDREKLVSNRGAFGKSKITPLLTLYTGPGCHLCELAGDILDDVVGAEAYEVVSISGSEQLKADYGERIPVVKNKAGREKGWPFTAGQIKKMVL